MCALKASITSLDRAATRLPDPLAFSRAVLTGGGGGEEKGSQRQQKRTFTGTLSASWPWDLLYFKGWRLAVGGWRLAFGGGWRLVAVGGGWQLAVGGGWWLVVSGSGRLAVGGGWSLGAVLKGCLGS